MTATIDYLLENDYCLLCAQEECGVCDNGWDRESPLRLCLDCDGTRSRLVKIADHPVEHEHVVATSLMFLGKWIDMYAADHEQGEWPYEILANGTQCPTMIADDDYWRMAEAVGGFQKVDDDLVGTCGFRDWEVGEDTYDTPEEAVTRAFIAQKYREVRG